MAQVVEHILGKDEVTGSSPVISSKDRDAQSPLSFFMPKNKKGFEPVTRGSKFIYEFGRNSTVYCFVASGYFKSPVISSKDRDAQSPLSFFMPKNKKGFEPVTRGSKFIYEFGRNSTVYCFVASGYFKSPVISYVQRNSVFE